MTDIEPFDPSDLARNGHAARALKRPLAVGVVNRAGNTFSSNAAGTT